MKVKLKVMNFEIADDKLDIIHCNRACLIFEIINTTTGCQKNLNGIGI